MIFARALLHRWRRRAPPAARRRQRRRGAGRGSGGRRATALRSRSPARLRASRRGLQPPGARVREPAQGLVHLRPASGAAGRLRVGPHRRAM